MLVYAVSKKEDDELLYFDKRTEKPARCTVHAGYSLCPNP